MQTKTASSKNPYDYFHRLVLDQICNARSSGKISTIEERMIGNYITLKETEQISPARYYKIAYYLLRIRTETGISNYQTCSTMEVQTSWNRIRSLTVKPLRQDRTGTPDAEPSQAAGNQRTLSPNTISDMQAVFKTFIIWLSDTKQNKVIDIRAIQKMKPAKQNLHTVTPDSIITPEDLQHFFNACTSKRDAALFRLMYSAALRIGEVCSLKIKDVYGIGDISAALWNREDLDRPVFIQTAGKTGIIRKIPITDRETKQALYIWLTVYPDTITPDAYLFVNNRGLALTPGAVSLQLKRISAKAGISKHIHAHLFRHTRITELSRAGLGEAHIKRIAWGHLDTRMIDVYSHLTPDDTAAALIKLQEEKRL